MLTVSRLFIVDEDLDVAVAAFYHHPVPLVIVQRMAFIELLWEKNMLTDC